MKSKIFNYHGQLVRCACVVKWTTYPEVGVQVQDQMNKKENLEYSVMCVVEGVGMKVCKEGATWKIRWEDISDGKMRKG